MEESLPKDAKNRVSNLKPISIKTLRAALVRRGQKADP